jgi:hypothetical protein
MFIDEVILYCRIANLVASEGKHPDLLRVGWGYFGTVPCDSIAADWAMALGLWKLAIDNVWDIGQILGLVTLGLLPF